MSGWFVAVDVETANANLHSICQIGLVAFQGQDELWRWTANVDPEEDFDAINIRIHGIRSMDVAGAPKFPDVWAAIEPSLRGQYLVSHTRFDRNAIGAAASKYGLTAPPCWWLDTWAIAREAWPDLQNHKLDTLADHFGISLRHHSALDDAAACGQILTRAIAKTNVPLSEWEARSSRNAYEVVKPTAPAAGRRRYPERIEIKGRRGGPLSGHVVVFTGDFSIGELRIAQIASELGCDVEERFTKKRTTILVVGKRDPAQFNGKEKSNKQMGAEAAIAEGYKIAIMDEDGFLRLAQRHVAA